MKGPGYKTIVFFFMTLGIAGCGEKAAEDKNAAAPAPAAKVTGSNLQNIQRLPGVSEEIPREVAQIGEVYIAYSDCYTCHKEDRRSIGPPFKAVAKRYPSNEAYINMLAQKVLAGGSGAWGQAIMPSHKDIPLDHAKKMVSYILSLQD